MVVGVAGSFPQYLGAGGSCLDSRFSQNATLGTCPIRRYRRCLRNYGSWMVRLKSETGVNARGRTQTGIP